MSGLVTINNITYTRINLRLRSSKGDVNQPQIFTKAYRYIGKKTSYPFSEFRVSYHYRGIISPFKTLTKKAVSEMDQKYLPAYSNSNFTLSYRDLWDVEIQVNALNS